MDFILVPDALAANEVRYALAKNNTVGTRVGSFPVLLETLAELWLLEPTTQNWDDLLQEKALAMENAFWSKSIQVDELATIKAITTSLQFLLDHSPVGSELQTLTTPKNRQQRYYNDLINLQQAIQVLPDQHQLVKQWLAVCNGSELEPLNLYPTFDVQDLLPWQQGVLTVIQNKGWLQPQANKYKSLLPTIQSSSDHIRNLATTLFHKIDEPLSQPKDNVLWLKCRDAAEEAEATVAIIQKALEEDKQQPEDFAVVVPKGSSHSQWLDYYLQKAGIQASNIRPVANRVDWQAALIQNLLSHLAQPTVSMAMQSVLINPLMPWGSVTGQRFADRYRSYQSAVSKDEEQQIILTILQGSETKPLSINSASQVFEWLRNVSEQLSYKKVIGFGKKRMHEQLSQLERLFKLHAELSFEQQLNKVLKQLTVGTISLNDERQRYLDAVLVLEESEALPKSVQQLFVLGFNNGHYEYKQNYTGALKRQDWEELRNSSNSSILQNIPSLLDEQRCWKHSFTCLLQAAQQRIIFMRSLTDAEGKLLDVSETLIDMALCYSKPEQLDPEALECSLAASSLITWDTLHPTKTVASDFPEELQLQLEQGNNLVGIYHNYDGQVRPESPSSLEKMMLSPLAWLLSRLRIESKKWEVATLKPNVAGSIAHQVFEDYADFQDEVWDELKVRHCIDKAVNKHGFFLNGPIFTMAKQQLSNDIVKALAAMHEWRQQKDENNQHWRITEKEKKLSGKEFGVAVQGNTDAILQKGDDVLILDYKNTQHKNRLLQLKEGYELQTRLYRSLYHQTLKKETGSDAKGIVTSGYYTMKDQMLITDYALQSSKSVQVKQAGDKSLADQSKNAETHILETIDKLKNGVITLNSAEDEKMWGKTRGLSVYTLTEDRLVQRFTIGNNTSTDSEDEE